MNCTVVYELKKKIFIINEFMNIFSGKCNFIIVCVINIDLLMTTPWKIYNQEQTFIISTTQ